MILFNSYTPDYSWLSNFSPHPVRDFPTAEHAYQAAKSTRREDWAYVKTLATAKEVKAWSYKIPAEHRRPDWEEVKERIMYKALLLKFMDPQLREMLIDTGTHDLLHYAPWGDTYWGVNKQGLGSNRQGILLMELREELRGWYERLYCY